jgi:hypothetical protein
VQQQRRAQAEFRLSSDRQFGPVETNEQLASITAECDAVGSTEVVVLLLTERLVQEGEYLSGGAGTIRLQSITRVTVFSFGSTQ